MTPRGLLEPDARTTGTSGSEGGGAPQGAPPTRQYLWANLKGAELANFGGGTVPEVADQAQHGIRRVCASDSLVIGFLAHTGLSPDDEPAP